MSDAYVIRNQAGQYWARRHGWVSGRDTSIVTWERHYDQALNELLEINAKDITLRGRVEGVPLSDKRRPMITELGPDPVQPDLPDIELAVADNTGGSDTVAVSEESEHSS